MYEPGAWECRDKLQMDYKKRKKGITKGILTGRREMMPDGILDLHKKLRVIEVVNM